MVPERKNPIPLYCQIANDIRQKIQSAIYPPGACLPSEIELMKLYKVGRVTIRQAIGTLLREDQLVTHQGKGTFVSSKRIEQELLNLKSITEVLLSKGEEPTVKVLERKIVIPPMKVKSELRLQGNEKVITYKRLYLVRHSPLSLVCIYLPLQFAEIMDPLQKESLPTETTYTIFERNGILLREARHVIRATPANQDEAKWLKVHMGTPILTVERTTFSKDNQPLEYIAFHYRADKFEFSARLPRSLHTESNLVEEIVNNFRLNHLNRE